MVIIPRIVVIIPRIVVIIVVIMVVIIVVITYNVLHIIETILLETLTLPSHLDNLDIERYQDHSFPTITMLRSFSKWHVGLSENSVPLNPMVDDHYPY